LKSHFRNLLILGSIFAVGSGVFSFIFHVRFNLSRRVVPTHILIVLVLLLGSLLTAAVLRAVWKTGKWTTVLPVGLFAIALCELYIFTAIGWMLWIDAISIRILASYLPQLFRTPGTPAPLSYYLPLAPSAAAVVLLLFVVYRAMPALFRSISWAVDPRGLAIFGGKRIALYGFASLLFYSIPVTFLFWSAIHYHYLRDDPVIGLFRPDSTNIAELPSTFYDLAQRPPGEDAPYLVSSKEQRKSVIVILVDALRADHLTRFGYFRNTTPLLSRRLENAPMLASEWTTSACSVSECGILALMTSRPYQRLNAGLFALPEALHRAGYRTYFDMSGDFTIAYRGLRTLSAEHAQIFADGLSDNGHRAYDDRVMLRTLERLPNHSQAPAFFYFHLHSAHEAGEKYLPPTWTPTGLNLRRMVEAHYASGSAVDREILTNNYDNGIRQADNLIEQILSTLKRKGYLDRSVVVVTADHGEALGEHNAWLHGKNLYAESINIPLFFLDTDFKASRTVPYATQLDIAPTIADLVGIPIPVQWEGRSLLGPVPEISTAQTTSYPPIEAVIWRTADASWKYIFDSLDNTEQLFEIRSDPGEQNNRIANVKPALLEFLRETRARKFRGPLELARGHR
jgi:glucan phosphoethanolaminetransferase (alkaline phosphatase superfamily)